MGIQQPRTTSASRGTLKALADDRGRNNDAHGRESAGYGRSSGSMGKSVGFSIAGEQAKEELFTYTPEWGAH